MKKLSYFVLGIIFVGATLTHKNGTNLSNTPGISCTSYFTARSVATDAKNRVHAVWADAEDIHSPWCLYYRRSTDGGTNWEDTVRLADSVYVWSVSVATNNLDAVSLCWISDNGLHYKHSLDGGLNWRPDTLLNEDTTSAVPLLMRG